MTLRLSLRPISQIVLLHEAERPSHADEDAKIDKRIFEPSRAIETFVNESPMHADGMTAT